MKIGILTFYWTDYNYGQVLQCYALSQYLSNAGHEVFIIDYDKRKDYIEDTLLVRLKKVTNLKMLLYYIQKKAREKIQCVINKKKNSNRKFNDFKNSYIHFSQIKYSSYNDLKKHPPEADMYIVGSDQVWNFLDSNLARYENWINAYFLNFGRGNIKKISYAASFGTSKIVINEKYSKLIGELLCDFNYISVREIEGIEICKSLGVSDVHLDPDPTLLLSAETYRQLYSENQITNYCISDKPYVFLYLLGNECDFDFKAFIKWTSEKGLNIKYVSDTLRIDRYEKIYPTIPEWLWLIDHSSYVITNSFHGTVFSIIFNKKFLTIPLSGNAQKMNCRISTLFRQFNIKNRWLNDNNYNDIDESYSTFPVFDKSAFLHIINNI